MAGTSAKAPPIAVPVANPNLPAAGLSAAQNPLPPSYRPDSGGVKGETDYGREDIGPSGDESGNPWADLKNGRGTDSGDQTKPNPRFGAAPGNTPAATSTGKVSELENLGQQNTEVQPGQQTIGAGQGHMKFGVGGSTLMMSAQDFVNGNFAGDKQDWSVTTQNVDYMDSAGNSYTGQITVGRNEDLGITVVTFAGEDQDGKGVEGAGVFGDDGSSVTEDSDNGYNETGGDSNNDDGNSDDNSSDSSSDDDDDDDDGTADSGEGSDDGGSDDGEDEYGTTVDPEHQRTPLTAAAMEAMLELYKSSGKGVNGRILTDETLGGSRGDGMPRGDVNIHKAGGDLVDEDGNGGDDPALYYKQRVADVLIDTTGEEAGPAPDLGGGGDAGGDGDDGGDNVVGGDGGDDGDDGDDGDTGGFGMRIGGSGGGSPATSDSGRNTSGGTVIVGPQGAGPSGQ